MRLPGSNTWVRYLQRPAILVTLFVMLLLIFIFRRRMISLLANNIFNNLTAAGFKNSMAGFVVAQTAHETAGYTSNIFKKNNNLFGMKYAGQYNAAGEKNGYAYYNNYTQSIYDFIQWVQRRRAYLNINTFDLITLKQYTDWLKLNDYYEDSSTNYYNGCLRWYKKLFG